MAVTLDDVLKVIVAILLPPLGVFLEVGCDVQLAINIALTFCGYLPGKINPATFELFDCRNCSCVICDYKVLKSKTSVSVDSNQ